MASKSDTGRQSVKNNKPYPLLDVRWIYKKPVPIFRLPNREEFSDESSPWIGEMNELISYYSYLLTCAFDKFWSEVKFQNNLSLSVSSFLECCPRTLQNSPFPRKVTDVILRLHLLVFFILKRASQACESEAMMLRNFEHGEIIYQSKLFNLSSMIDIAILYGDRYPDTVGIIFASVFKENSKFVNDAVSIMQCALTALSQVENEVTSWQFDEKHQLVAPSSDSLSKISRAIEYIVEAGCSLGAFLSFLAPVNSSVAELCVHKGIISSLARFYNSTVVNIQDHVLRCMTWSSEKKSYLLSRLAIAAASLVKTVRVGLVEPGLVNRIMHLAYGDPSTSSSQALADIFSVFIDVMVEMLNYNEFATVYALLYPVADDISLVREAASSANVDKAQLDYLQNAYARLAEQCSVKRAESADAKKVKKEEMDKAPKADTPTASQSVEEPQPGCSRSFDFRTLKAVLPDVEDDLIERCLEYYKNDTQAIITALLDGSVPLSVSNPEFVKPHTEFKAEDLWQGKRQNVTALQPLSAEDKQRVTNLAVSVWDDEDAIGGYNYGDNDDENVAANRMEARRGVDFIYEDEYDDTFDGETGVDIERTEEDEAVDAEPVNMAELKPSNFQPPVFRSQGDMRGNHQKHRYRQEPPMQHHRQQPQRNVLQMENPEVVRQRRQHNEKAVAARRGHVDLNRRAEVPPQPSIPEMPGSEMTEPSPSSSRPNYSHMRNLEVDNCTTQYGGGGYGKGRPHNRGSGSFTIGKGRGRGHGKDLPAGRDDANARKLNERHGPRGERRCKADKKAA